MPTLKAIHICNSLNANTPPKIAKEYGLPTLTSVLTEKPRKTKQNAESLCTTSAISNWGLSA